MGVSKHYIITTSGGNQYVDYDAVRCIAAQVPAYESNTTRAMRLREQCQVIMDHPSGWRQKLKALLPLRTPLFKRDFCLTEYSVYPGRKAASCRFRRTVQGFRKLKKKASKTAPLNTEHVVFGRLPTFVAEFPRAWMIGDLPAQGPIRR